MSKNKDLTVDSIIKKYEQRQQQLSQSLVKNKEDANEGGRKIEESAYVAKSGSSTPEFNSTTHRKDKNYFNEYNINKTQKKNQSYESFNPKQIGSSPFNNYTSQRRDYQSLLAKLDQTEERLARSERNYADIWRKYEQMLKDGQRSGKQIDIEYKLRQKQVQELNIHISSLQKQNKNLKECINAKDENLSALRDRLKEKNQRVIQNQRLIENLRTEMELLKTKQQKFEEIEDYKKSEKEAVINKLQNELAKFENMFLEKDKEKKDLLLQMEKNYIMHRQQLELLRTSYSKVEDEYKEWIQQCNNEKMSMMEQYEHRIKQLSKTMAYQNLNGFSAEQLQQQVLRKDQEIAKLFTQNMKLTNELKINKISLEDAKATKNQLINKVSNLENSVIERVQNQRILQSNLQKLQLQFKNQEEKNNDLSLKYNSVNNQFQQLKSKCSIMFCEIEQKKRTKHNQSTEIVRLKKEIQTCKQQLEKSRNNEMSLSNKLADSLILLKTKTLKFQHEKEEVMTDFLAERLENAKLKQQIKQTKQNLKRQYELSIQNTRKELEMEIRTNTKRAVTAGCDMEKEQLYLQLRELERRYELLASEVVTVDEMIGMSSKVQRRYQQRK